MGFFKRLIDFITLRAERPMRRLFAYYVVLATVVIGSAMAFPVVDRLLGGAPQEVLETPDLLEDALAESQAPAATPVSEVTISRLEKALETVVICLGTLVLMLPVSWVYMSAQNSRSHNQMVAQTLRQVVAHEFPRSA